MSQVFSKAFAIIPSKQYLSTSSFKINIITVYKIVDTNLHEIINSHQLAVDIKENHKHFTYILENKPT